MDLHSNIYVAGHHGLVGSAIVRALQEAGYRHIITRTSRELDLRNKEAVDHFFETEPVDYVFWQLPRLVGFWRITNIRLILSVTICLYKQM